MATPIPQIQELFEHAQQAMWTNHMELIEAYRYTEPSREFEKLVENQVTHREWQFDATPLKCVSDLQTNILNLLVPSSERWADIVWVKDADEAKWGHTYSRNVDAANQQLFNFLARSNFYTAYGEATKDDIIGGTACLFIINRPGRPISFMPVPLNQLFFLEDFDGSVSHVFRKHSLTTDQITSQFGRVPDAISAADPKETKLHELVEAQVIDPITRKVTYCVYLKSNWEPLSEPIVSKYRFFHVWRWSKQIGNPWGNSPVRNALPSIRALNVMVQCMLAAGEYASQGLWQVAGGVTNVDNIRVQMVPGSLVAVEEKLEPLEFPGNFQIGVQQIADTRQQVQALLLSQPQRDPNLTPITAEQVVAERDEFFKLIGEPARRMQDESLQPIAEDVFGMLVERGDIQLVTLQQLKTISPHARSIGDVFKVEVTAAITKVLKIQDAQQNLQALQVLAQTFGEQMVYKHFDLDAITRDAGLNLGVSPQYLRTKKEADQLAQQQQQAAQASEMGAQVTDFAKTAAKTPAGQSFINQALNNAAAIRNSRPVVNASQNVLTS